MGGDPFVFSVSSELSVSLSDVVYLHISLLVLKRSLSFGVTSKQIVDWVKYGSGQASTGSACKVCWCVQMPVLLILMAVFTKVGCAL